MAPNEKQRRPQSLVVTSDDRIDQLIHPDGSSEQHTRSPFTAAPSTTKSVILPILADDPTSYVQDSALSSAAPTATIKLQKPTAPSTLSSFSELKTCMQPERVKLDSPGIYRYNSKIYCGKPKDFPVSKGLQDAWDRPEGIRHRLLIDLRPAADEVRARGSTRPPSEARLWEELRTSGSRDPSWKIPSVLLYPCIWIFCGSKWCKKLVEKALKNLSWVENLFPHPIEVHVGGPGLCVVPSCISLPRLQLDAAESYGFDFAGGRILYHLEAPAEERHYKSACGLLCCTTYLKDGRVVHQHISRIGGLLKDPAARDGSQAPGGEAQNYKHFATTVAHGVPDYLILDQAEGSWNTTDSPMEDISDDEMSDGTSSPEDSDPDSTEIGRKDSSRVKWLPIDEVLAVNFLGRRLPPSHGPEKAALAGDYALLRSRFLQDFENYYTRSGIKMVNSYLSDANLTEGPMLLLADPDNVVECDLLPGESHFTMHGAAIPTRKVQLSAPLALGTSGSWLVRDGALCGMIIANYPGEPLALFITVEKILTDMLRSFPDLGNSQKFQEPEPEPPFTRRTHRRREGTHEPPLKPGYGRQETRGRSFAKPGATYTITDRNYSAEATIDKPYADIVRLPKDDQTTLITKDLVSQEALNTLRVRYTEHEAHYNVQKFLEDGTITWLTQYTKTYRRTRGQSPAYNTWYSTYGNFAAKAAGLQSSPERKPPSDDCSTSSKPQERSSRLPSSSEQRPGCSDYDYADGGQSSFSDLIHGQSRDEQQYKNGIFSNSPHVVGRNRRGFSATAIFSFGMFRSGEAEKELMFVTYN